MQNPALIRFILGPRSHKMNSLETLLRMFGIHSCFAFAGEERVTEENCLLADLLREVGNFDPVDPTPLPGDVWVCCAPAAGWGTRHCPDCEEGCFNCGGTGLVEVSPEQAGSLLVRDFRADEEWLRAILRQLTNLLTPHWVGLGWTLVLLPAGSLIGEIIDCPEGRSFVLSEAMNGPERHMIGVVMH